MTQTITIEQKDNQVYEVKSPDESIVLDTQCNCEKVIVDGPSKVSIITIPPSSPGPRGRSLFWEDLTASQKAEITPTVSVGTTTTLPAGNNASVTDSGSDKNHILDFAIPQGIQGQAATIQVAGTVTVNPDTPASVINEGSETDARFRFHIPRGQTGEVGPKGEDGISPTIRVGTTTTGQPGSQASVTNSGTAQNAILNFSIPRGAQGNPGPAGKVQDVMVSYDSGETWESALTGNVAEIIMTGGSGGGGGEINRINKIQKNGVDLPIVNKVVNVPIPTATSELTNDSGFITSASVPTKVSDLQNDSGFITSWGQADYNQTDTTEPDYIKNKPYIPHGTSDTTDNSNFLYGYTVVAIAQEAVNDFKTNSAGVPAAALLQTYAENPTLYPNHNVWYYPETIDGQCLSSYSYYLNQKIASIYATQASIPHATLDMTDTTNFIAASEFSPLTQTEIHEFTRTSCAPASDYDIEHFAVDNPSLHPSHPYIDLLGIIDKEGLSSYTYYLNQKIASIYATQASLSTVATSGDYDDLSNKPTIHNIPSGGTTGQVLTKNSNTDYDTSWQTPSNPETYSVVVVTDGEIPSTLKVGQMCIAQSSRKNSSGNFYVVVPANQGWMIVTGSPTVGIFPNVLASRSSTRNFVIGSSSGSVTSRVCFAVRTS